MITPAFFEPVSAALLVLETAVIVAVWVMIQLEAYLTPLLVKLHSEYYVTLKSTI